VELEAGVQVLKFQSVVEHLNIDYLQLSLVTDGEWTTEAMLARWRGGMAESDSGRSDGRSGGAPVQVGAAGSSSTGAREAADGASGDAVPMARGNPAATTALAERAAAARARSDRCPFFGARCSCSQVGGSSGSSFPRRSRLRR